MEDGAGGLDANDTNPVREKRTGGVASVRNLPSFVDS
jgi:hypothetical protein